MAFCFLGDRGSRWYDIGLLHEKPREIPRKMRSCGCLWWEYRNTDIAATDICI